MIGGSCARSAESGSSGSILASAYAESVSRDVRRALPCGSAWLDKLVILLSNEKKYDEKEICPVCGFDPKKSIGVCVDDMPGSDLARIVLNDNGLRAAGCPCSHRSRA